MNRSFVPTNLATGGKLHALFARTRMQDEFLEWDDAAYCIDAASYSPAGSTQVVSGFVPAPTYVGREPRKARK